jgi:hypothetical protein
MDIPRRGFLRGGRDAVRTNRFRRTARSLAQQARRAVGFGGVPDERVRDIIGEGRRARRFARER